MTSIAILGGGISGLSLGWKLAQAEVPTTILEAESFLGGLAGTLRQDGYFLDFGPHSFFSEDEEIRKTVFELMGPDLLFQIPRRVKFYYRGRYLDYPFTALSILAQMGPSESVKTFLSYLRHKISGFGTSSAAKDQTVEEWAVSHFGPRLYKAFFKPYTEQFWKIPCSELSARTIPSHTRLSFLKTLKHFLRQKISKTSLMQLEREKLPTTYPKYGYGEIAGQIAKQFESLSGVLKTQARIQSLHTAGEAFLIDYPAENSSIETLSADTVVSTLPLPVLISILQPCAPSSVQKAAERLEYRPILFLGLAVDRDLALNASYMYLLNRPYNRITDMNRFSPAASPTGENLIGLEIPCRFGDENWYKTPEELFESCADSLEEDGVLKRHEVKKIILAKNRYAYPVYRKNYAADLKTVLDYIHSIPNLYTLGRSGEFMYMDADQCMRRSFDLAQNLIRSKGGLRAGSAVTI